MNNIDIAKKVAELLDQNNFEEVQRYFSVECSYLFRGKVCTGPEEIVASYKAGADRAAIFDEYQFFSEVSKTDDPNVFVVHYLDRLRKGDEWHDHRCEQILTVSEGKVVKVEHRDLPGEEQTLADFMKRTGTSFGSPSP